jgi:hypothetical protein
MIEFKTLPLAGLPDSLMIKISHSQCTLTVCRNSQTAAYLAESPNPQYTHVYHVSHFNPTGIALTAFFLLVALFITSDIILFT